MEESFPPPLPSPWLVENETVVANSDRDEKCDETAVDSQMEKEREGDAETHSEAVSFSGIPGISVNGIITVSGTGREDDKESEKQYHAVIPTHLHNHHQQHKHQHHEHQSPQQDEKQHNSTHSDYHTPSPISDDELKQLSHGEVVTAEKRPDEGEGGHQVTVEGEENTDGAVFQSQHFTSTAPPIKFNSLDCGNGSGVWHKPCSRKAETSANRPTLSTDLHSTSNAATVSAAKEPGVVEDASSTTSSLQDALHCISKDGSSLSLDRHGDVEESAVHVLDKERGRGRGEVDVHARGADEDELLRWNVDNHSSDKDHSFLFPVSNSPMDIVTMLTRLACFTSTLLDTLTPKLRHGAMPAPDEPRVSQ